MPVSLKEVCTATPDILCLVVRDAPLGPGWMEGPTTPDPANQNATVTKLSARTGQNRAAKVVGPRAEYRRFMGDHAAGTDMLDRTNVKNAGLYAVSGMTVTGAFYFNRAYIGDRGHDGLSSELRAVSFEHHIYLKLSGNLTNGVTYTITVPFNLSQQTFQWTFNDKTTRCVGLRINQVGYGNNDPIRNAALALNINEFADHGGHGFVQYSNYAPITNTFHLINDAGTIVHTGSIALRTGPLDAEVVYDANGAPMYGAPSMQWGMGRRNPTGSSTHNWQIASASIASPGQQATITTATPHSLRVNDHLWFHWARAGQIANYIGGYTNGITITDLDGQFITYSGEGGGIPTPVVGVDSTTQFRVQSVPWSQVETMPVVGNRSRVYRIIQVNLGGTYVYDIDFTGFSTAGSYRIYIPGLGVSDSVRIGTQPWWDVATAFVAAEHAQRMGHALDGRWGYTKPENFSPNNPYGRVYQSYLPQTAYTDDQGGISPTKYPQAGMVMGQVQWLCPTLKTFLGSAVTRATPAVFTVPAHGFNSNDRVVLSTVNPYNKADPGIWHYIVTSEWVLNKITNDTFTLTHEYTGETLSLLGNSAETGSTFAIGKPAKRYTENIRGGWSDAGDWDVRLSGNYIAPYIEYFLNLPDILPAAGQSKRLNVVKIREIYPDVYDVSSDALHDAVHQGLAVLEFWRRQQQIMGSTLAALVGISGGVGGGQNYSPDEFGYMEPSWAFGSRTCFYWPDPKTSYMYAGLAASAASVLSNAGLSTLAATWRQSARDAFAWAALLDTDPQKMDAHFAVLKSIFTPTDYANFLADQRYGPKAGSATGSNADFGYMSDYRLFGAAALYRATGEATFHNILLDEWFLQQYNPGNYKVIGDVSVWSSSDKGKLLAGWEYYRAMEEGRPQFTWPANSNNKSPYTTLYKNNSISGFNSGNNASNWFRKVAPNGFQGPGAITVRPSYYHANAGGDFGGSFTGFEGIGESYTRLHYLTKDSDPATANKCLQIMVGSLGCILGHNGLNLSAVHGLGARNPAHTLHSDSESVGLRVGTSSVDRNLFGGEVFGQPLGFISHLTTRTLQTGLFNMFGSWTSWITAEEFNFDVRGDGNEDPLLQGERLNKYRNSHAYQYSIPFNERVWPLRDAVYSSEFSTQQTLICWMGPSMYVAAMNETDSGARFMTASSRSLQVFSTGANLTYTPAQQQSNYALTKFQNFVEDLGKGVHNFSSHTLKVALSTAAPNTTWTQLSQVTQIGATGGYPSGGYALTVSWAETAGIGRLSITDKQVQATGDGLTFRYAVVYNDTATGDPLIGFYDFGSVTLNTNDVLNINFDDAAGAFTVQ
jgi:hypothetical protein